MPVAINLGNTYSNYLDTIEENASYVVEDGYAGVMGFNMRSACDVNATPVFNAWAQGLGEGSVCWNGDCYPQRTPFIPGGYTITNADVPSNY